MAAPRFPAGILLLLMLAACAGQQPRVAIDTSWQEHSSRLQGLTHWTAEGKLALRTPDQSESASLQWQQQGENTRLQLSGPLGVAATTLDSDGRTLRIHRGEETSTWDLADTAALERRTGWDLPLLALPHWLKGMPAPGLKVQRMKLGPDPALLDVLKQDGWEIRFELYENFGNFTLPTQLRIHRKDTSVRVIIRDWQVFPG